jgi:hypothetical protein
MSKAAAGGTAMSNAELVSRYEKGISVFEEALKDLPSSVLDRVPAPGKWTIRQIANHLADAELVACARLRWIIAEPGSPLKAYDQDKWASQLGYDSRTPGQSLELFRALRQSTAAMLRAVPDSAWGNTGIHEERGVVSLSQTLETYTTHAEHHAQQIRQLRQQLSQSH